MSKFIYPSAVRDETSDMLFGNKVTDPYRWLEDPDAPETVAFVKSQNEIVQSFLLKSDIRDKFKDKMTKLMDYEKHGCPMKRADWYYYFHNTGLQAQSVLFRKKELDGEGSVFFDPNTLSSDGTVSIGTFSFSEAGKYFAYALSKSGSDWVSIHICKTDSASRADIEPALEWAKFTSISWTHDDLGFTYNRYPTPKVSSDKAGTETDSNMDAAIYYHRLGTPQSQDILLFDVKENPSHMPRMEVSDDGKYLICCVSESCDPQNKVYFAEISSPLLNKPEFNVLVG